MDIRYSQIKNEPLLKGGGEVDMANLFNELFLRSNGSTAQALDWMREILQQHGFLNRDKTFDDILDELENAGLIERNKDEIVITPKGKKNIRDSIFENAFSNLQKSMKGDHSILSTGRGGQKLTESRPYEYGDDFNNIHLSATLENTLKRQVTSDFNTMSEEDIEIYEQENKSNCSTVLMLDISHSMILYGEDRITPAKIVAISLVEFIRRRFPSDTVDVLTFGNEAKQISPDEIAEVAIGPYHTNTCDGLKLAQHLLKKRKNVNKQIIMITDGKPSAVYDRGRLYKNSNGLDPLVLQKTYAEALNCKKNKYRVTTFMVAQDNYLIEFIDRFTKIVEGKAFFTGLDNLQEMVFTDYVNNRKKKL